jgi:fatty-acyl-CoA synthase
MNLTDGLDFWTRWRPDAEALVASGTSYSWRQLSVRCDRLAAGFAAAGIGKGDRIAIYAGNDVRWYETVFAALRLGALVVPVNLRITAAVVASILDDAECSLVIADAERLATLRQIPDSAAKYRLYVFEDEPDAASFRFDDLYAANGLSTTPQVGDEDAAVIAYTSGTTGEPKGAVLTHGSILGFAGALSRALNWSTDTRYLHMGSLSYTAGILQGILVLSIAGGTLVLEDQFETGRLVELLCLQPITAWHGLPVQWEELIRLDSFEQLSFPLLISTITGGGAIAEELFATVARRGIALRHVYGMTEAGGTITMATLDSIQSAPGSAGLPLMHTTVRIVDDDLRDVAPGELGEIVVRSAAMMREYWRRPEATQLMIVDGWLRTGDVGRIDSRGLLYVIDRRSNAISSGGGLVYPAEIERAALGIGDVIDAVAVGVPDVAAGNAVLLVLRSGGLLDEASVLQQLRTQLAPHTLPRRVIVVDEPLPRSQTGKILRADVRARYRNAVLDRK